jgi:hypothetical protein
VKNLETPAAVRQISLGQGFLQAMFALGTAGARFGDEAAKLIGGAGVPQDAPRRIVVRMNIARMNAVRLRTDGRHAGSREAGRRKPCRRDESTKSYACASPAEPCDAVWRNGALRRKGRIATDACERMGSAQFSAGGHPPHDEAEISLQVMRVSPSNNGTFLLK